MIDYTTLARRTGPVTPTPLVPQDNLYLTDRGLWDGETMFLTPPRIIRKFVRCFKKVWIQIPEQDRQVLKEFWKLCPDSGRPLIALVPLGLELGWAASCLGGYELLFDIDHLEISTPTFIGHRIAHELGHAISHPHGWYSQHECDRTAGECVACECRAYSYMAAWGFDPFFDVLPKRKRLIDRFRSRQR